jgi:hypothetical protein
MLRCKDEVHSLNLKENMLKQQRLNIKIGLQHHRSNFKVLKVKLEQHISNLNSESKARSTQIKPTSTQIINTIVSS